MGCVQQLPQVVDSEGLHAGKEQLVFGMSDFVHEVQGSITNEYQLITPPLGKGSFG